MNEVAGALGEAGPVVVRGLFAILMFWSFFRSPVIFESTPYPNGLGRFVDLGRIGGPRGALPLRVAGTLLLVPYALGIGLPVVAPLLFLFALVIGSAFNSLGKIGHARQTVALVMAVQALACVAASLGILPGASALPGVSALAGGAEGQSAALDFRMLDWSQQVIVAFYLTAGITKLHRSGLAWMRDVSLIPVEIVKSVEECATTRGRRSSDDTSLAAGAWLARHPAITRVLFSTGLVLELAAPLALYSRATILFGVLFLLFHQSVLMLMKMRFVESRALAAIFFIAAEVL